MLIVIAIEGLDGSGKETLCRALSNYLENNKANLQIKRIKTVSFPNYEIPSGQVIGKMLSKSNELYTDMTPLQRAFMTASLFTYNRYETIDSDSILKTFIKQTTSSEDINILICDRYVASNTIYQTMDLELPDVKKFIEYQCLEFGKLPRPDISIFLDVDIEIILERLKARTANKTGQDNDKYEKEAFMRKCYENIHKLLESKKDVGITDMITNVVKGSENGKPLSIENILLQILPMIMDRISFLNYIFTYKMNTERKG